MENPRTVLAQHWPTVERISEFIGRKYRLRVDEVEDLVSLVAVKLYEDDCRIMRECRVSLPSFLRVVIQRIFLDDYIHQKGKWHSGAEAKRLGPAAVDLERLIYRDGMAHDDAIARVQSEHPETSRGDLEAIIARLPHRARPARVPLDDTVAESTPNQDQTDLLTVDRERREMSERAAGIIRDYLAMAAPHDRLMLQFQFESNMHISQIARVLQVEQAVLYRRRPKLLRELAAVLQENGITAAEVADLIGHIDDSIDFGLKTGDPRPSPTEGTGVAGKGVPR